MKNNTNPFATAFVGGIIGGLVGVALGAEDYAHMRVTQVSWVRMDDKKRAGALRSYARNVLKTIRETPTSLSNQRSQARKLYRLTRLAYSYDPSTVSARAVNSCARLQEALDRSVGFRPVEVGPIDIS